MANYPQSLVNSGWSWWCEACCWGVKQGLLLWVNPWVEGRKEGEASTTVQFIWKHVSDGLLISLTDSLWEVSSVSACRKCYLYYMLMWSLFAKWPNLNGSHHTMNLPVLHFLHMKCHVPTLMPKPDSLPLLWMFKSSATVLNLKSTILK